MTEKLFLTRIKTHAYDFPSAKEQGIDSAKAIRCVMSSFNLQKHMSQYGTWQYLTVPLPCMLLARITYRSFNSFWCPGLSNVQVTLTWTFWTSKGFYWRVQYEYFEFCWINYTISVLFPKEFVKVESFQHFLILQHR